MSERPTAHVYIDGFNLYNGLKRRAEQKGLSAPEYRWLNLVELAEHLLPDYEVKKVRYFTSHVKRRAADSGAGQRQQIFIRALKTLRPKLSIHYGYFQRNVVWRHVFFKHRTLARLMRRRHWVRVIDYKEKGSDVNLASMLLSDAFNERCDAAAVISDDSDLALPITLAKDLLKEGVTLLNPNVREQPARKLRRVATRYRAIPDEAFAACVFPNRISDSKGAITKPPAW